MSLEQKFKSRMLSLMGDPRVIRSKRRLIEARRKIQGQAHVVSVFLQIDDPYSYILSHYLPRLAEQYDIELRLHLSQACGEAYQPEPALLAAYSVVDCTRLARELGIPFLDKDGLPPTEHRIGLSDAVAVRGGTDAFDAELRQALEVFWRGDTAAAARLSQAGNPGGEALALIKKSQALQKKLGHYSSAMLHYGGEWYWGIDRLHYLMQRLSDLGLATAASPDPLLESIQQATRVSLPVRPPGTARDLPPIEYFHSVRSPYSYLALPRIAEIADAFGVELKLRPVLPMVMRGLEVPRAKLIYIANDAGREASRRNVSFGKVADPVGAGAERCLAAYCYAESENRGREFLLNAGTAIWSDGIDLATDKGMRKLTGRTGLFWPGVKNAMESDDWRQPIEENRESMMNSGVWGVPTVRMGEYIAWGQDRDWMLARHLEELCDTGDGIIV